MLKAGVAGLCSDHLWPTWGKGVLKETVESGKYQIIAAADRNPPLLERIKNEFGVKNTYLSCHEMLEKEQLDVIVIGVPNNEKADIVELAAEKGIHVLIDKPLSANLEQANRIIKAVEKYRIKGIVYYPGFFDPKSFEIYNLVKQGAIGNIYQIEARVANAGPELHGCSKYFLEWLFDKEKNGGGALIDYGCYGSLYSRWLLGQPLGVIGLGGKFVKNNIEAEDNAVLLLRYQNAISIIQASWSEYASDSAWKFYPGPKLAVYGSEGAVIWHHWNDETLSLITKEYSEGKIIHPLSPPEEMKNPPTYLAHCIINDRPVEGALSLKMCRDVQEILEAGYRSINCKKEVPLPL
jgi:predicted dehydrogenase